VRPQSAAAAAITGLALGGTAAVTAFFGGVGWTMLSQTAVWPVLTDLERLAAAVDHDPSFTDGRTLQQVYPAARARDVVKKVQADLETALPRGLGNGFRICLALLVIPAVGQTLAVFQLRQRGDSIWRQWGHLLELWLPLTILPVGWMQLSYEKSWPVLPQLAGLAAAGFAVPWLFRQRAAVRRAAWGGAALALLVFVASDYQRIFSPAAMNGVSLGLMVTGALAAALAVWQQWPWWGRLVVYVPWAAVFLAAGLPTGSPLREESAQWTLICAAGSFSVACLAGIVSWICSTEFWKRRRAAQAAVRLDHASLIRRRRTMLRFGVAFGLLVIVGALAAIPWIQQYWRHRQLVEAIDQMAPDSPQRIRSLLQKGADIRTRGFEGDTVASVGAYWNDAKLVKQALEAGVDPNAVDDFGNTALIYSTFAPSVEPMKLLLDAGADVNHQTNRGDTALICAVRNAQFDQIKLLLDAGARTDLVNENGETALSVAQSLRPGGPRPMRPDLTSEDFVRLIEAASK
jgi:hypothetical protein